MPGPASTFCPVFPEDFLRQAYVEVRRKTASHQSVQRFQLALLLHEAPHLGHEEAGQRVGLSGRQVRRWRQRWATGDFAVTDASGRGRKAVFSPLDHALIKAIACELIAETQQPLSRQSLADVTARGRSVLGNRSVGARCGGCSTGMLSSRGVTSTGSSLVIRNLLRRQGRSWICMRAVGKAAPLARRTTSSAPTRKPASRRAGAAIRPFLPPRGNRPASKTSMNVEGRCNIWPRGTYAGGA